MESATPDARTRERLAQVSAVLGDDLPALSRALHEVLASEIVELDGDQLMLDLLRASGESNVETFLHFARYDIPIEEIEAPAAALEYSRRLAQRGISSNALQRAYRLGQRHVMRIALDLIAEHEPDREVALATGLVLLDKAFAYIDAISEKVVSEYEEERERWLANRTTVRATALRAVLSDDAVEETAAEQALGYRLRRDHVGARGRRRRRGVRRGCASVHAAGPLAGLGLDPAGTPVRRARPGGDRCAGARARGRSARRHGLGRLRDAGVRGDPS